MARPVGIRDQAILEAARNVFLRDGYGARTARVARAAGVSEGLLFKRFKTKNALFLAAMETEAGGSAWREDLMRAAGAGDMRKMLEAAGQQILKHLQIILPRIIMVRSSGLVLAPHAHVGASGLPHPIEKIRALAAYFRAEVKHGRLTMRNPDVQAQIFLGTLTHYVINEMLYGFRTASAAAYVRTVVDMILRAAAPAGAGRSRNGGRQRTKTKDTRS